MEVQMRTPLKRPLSFSDDSVEWDKIRDKIPADVGWNSLRTKSGSDDNVSVNVKGPPVDWTPYGYVSGRKAKKQRMDRVAAALSVKRTSTCTIDKLEDAGEREVAEQIALSVSKYCGSFVFESSDNEKFARLVPFPNSHASTKMPANDDWQLDKFDCKLETLMSKSPSSKVRSISFSPWKGAKRRERKYEVTNIKREVKLEDIIVEDGAFSWSTFANIVKPQLAAMEPKARCAAAKQFSALLQADPSAAK